MHIVNFSEEWVPQAKVLVEQAYQKMLEELPWFPEHIELPSFASLIEPELGLAAVDGGELLGFLASYAAFPNAFHTTGVKGVFCPLHGHGLKEGVHPKLFDYLYQAAAEKWAAQGIVSHAVCLYQHETELRELFVMNGFGVRCLDLARENTHILPSKACKATFREVASRDISPLLSLNNKLIAHLGASPIFMKFPSLTEQQFLERNQNNSFYIADIQGEHVAYLRFGPEGENFACNASPMIHCIGAFVLPEHQGSGLMDHLLAFAAEDLLDKGYPLIGVDCESINPNARHYWQKHFTAYTYSYVRRIDG